MYRFQDDPAPRFGRALATDALTQADLPLPAFTAEEKCVLELASHDGMRSVVEPGRIGKAIDSIFAVRRPRPLASPRLETLRRAAVLLRMKRELPEQERAQLHAVGFTPQHVALLEVLVGHPRSLGHAGRRA